MLGNRFPCLLLACLALAACSPSASAQENPARQDPQQDQLIRIDREKREVRVRCEALHVDMPLEFFCVVRGTADHEAVLRTTARPSAIHAALLGLGLEPGNPLRFIPERKEWLPPAGPPIRIEVEWEENGQTIRRRAGELMRNMRTGEAMPSHPWVFAGSELGPNGEYGADVTGQLVSIVNFEYTTLDVPRIASNANETLEWEINKEKMPPEGAQVWMVLTPVEGAATRAATTTGPTTRATEVPAPVEVVVVMLDQAGQVQVNNVPVALAETGAAVREHLPDGAKPESLAVRLAAQRGAPIDVLGRLLAELVRSEITGVIFTPPPIEAPLDPEAQEQPPRNGELILVHDGGTEVTVSGKRWPLGQFIGGLGQARQPAQEGDVQRGFTIRPADGATDLKPIDFAAVHAALYVLGYEVTVEAPGYGPASRAGGPADAKLAELRKRWEETVLPQSAALQQAAQTHYDVMDAYQREINRLLDEVERLRQEMDQLQQRYNELTAPKP